MSIRSININPSDLSIKPKKDKKTKKTSALTEPITINSTNIRKLLLEKLKEHKKTQKNIVLNKDNFDSKVPNYSNLKNGTKPTFRELNSMNSPSNSILPSNMPSNLNQTMPSNTPINLNQTMPSNTPINLNSNMSSNTPINLNSNMSSNTPINLNSNMNTLPDNDIHLPSNLTSNLVHMTSNLTSNLANLTSIPTIDKVDIFDLSSNIPYIQESEIKKTFHLGKNPKNKSISILIKSNKTRKHVENTKTDLKKTKLNTIKNYLKTKNLIKFGTSAPSGLLKEIYEASKLCGDVYNNNANTLIHNYNINNE